MKSRTHIYFFLIVLSLFLGLVAPKLFSDGMFMDGLIYAAVSNNMANGIGSFWSPHWSFGLFPEFFEHPPLAFGLQSICFRIFGDSIMVERFYSLFTFIIVGFLISAIWKHITKSYKQAWLPILLYILVAVVTWSYSNNMLENTMSVFVCTSALLYLKSRNKNTYIFLLLSGLSLSLALLTKGFSCLYIWTMPFFFWLIFKHNSFLKMILETVVLGLATVLPIALLFWYSQAAANYLESYFIKQVVGSIQNSATVSYRFEILIMFFQNIIAPVILSLIFLAIGLKKYRDITLDSIKKNRNYSLLFLLLMFSGILPIMISMKQRDFYILTVYPFFALSVALLISSVVEKMTTSISNKQLLFIKILSSALFIMAIAISMAQIGRIGRDKNKIKDCYNVIEVVGKNTCINIHSDLFPDWSLHGYFARYGHVSLIEKKFGVYEYYLTDNKSEEVAEYKEVDAGLNTYYLYKKIAH